MKIIVLIQMLMLVLACCVDELGPDAALSSGPVVHVSVGH
jgi:hypothetical protein